jgi:dolichol-phosphate mannosyltransferase
MEIASRQTERTRIQRPVVIIPTYNEADNIGRLIPQILAQDPRLSVLVVDDNSPDGTAGIVRALPDFGGRVDLLLRESKQGLGPAYRAGFKQVLEHTDHDAVFEMDADFSHDPAALPQFLREIATADLVLGSRYLHGITVVNWPLSRLILSVGANLYAQRITGLPVKDCTGGFKCFRRSVLESLPLERITSDGYSFQIEVNYHVWRKGFHIREIPIMFVDRQVGTSKMSRRIIWEAAWLVWYLRFKRMD